MAVYCDGDSHVRDVVTVELRDDGVSRLVHDGAPDHGIGCGLNQRGVCFVGHGRQRATKWTVSSHDPARVCEGLKVDDGAGHLSRSHPRLFR